MNIKYYLNKSKDVSIRDILSVFPMVLARLISPLFAHKYRDIWAISERKDEARDNGYHFFRYMTREHPEQKCIYVIDKKSGDYAKVKDLGTIVRYGSVRHWLLYFNCRYLISSQRFLPNGYMGTLIERMGLFMPDHIFLQHGITINKPEYLMADRWKVRLFVTATPQEETFVSKELGFEKEKVCLTGFARFDALHQFKTRPNRILIMPTWRKWLRFRSEEHSDAQKDIASSEYIKEWKKLLSSRNLDRLIRERNLEVVFIPHANMKGILDPSMIVGDHVIIAEPTVTDLQMLLKSSEMIITDYSSVFFDMAYMKKPILFFQFDEDKFRKYHYKEGWYSYRNSHFGDVCISAQEVLDKLEGIVDRHYEVSDDYLSEHKETFPCYDQRNSERIYEKLSQLT